MARAASGHAGQPGNSGDDLLNPSFPSIGFGTRRSESGCWVTSSHVARKGLQRPTVNRRDPQALSTGNTANSLEPRLSVCQSFSASCGENLRETCLHLHPGGTRGGERGDVTKPTGSSAETWEDAARRLALARLLPGRKVVLLERGKEEDCCLTGGPVAVEADAERGGAPWRRLEP